MTFYKNHLRLHLTAGLLLCVLFAVLDGYLTLKGIQGDISLEGNPLMKYMMSRFGPLGGLVFEKALVIIVALIAAVVAAVGIEKNAGWVYCLAFTQTTRNWMKRKKKTLGRFHPHLLGRCRPGACCDQLDRPDGLTKPVNFPGASAVLNRSSDALIGSGRNPICMAFALVRETS